MATPLANGWVQATAPDGRTYYANTATGATSWEFPADAGVAASPALPAGWTAAVDPSSGRTYYVHASGQTSWEVPTAGPAEAAPAAAAAAPAAAAVPKKKLSLVVRASWRKVLDYARTEATTKIQAKAKRFMGLRKFAELAAKRKNEAAEKKKRQQEEDEAAEAAARAEAAKPKRSILQMLDVDVPPVEKQNIEEYAQNWFNLNRKGIFGKQTTVTKILSWKNDVIKTSLLKMPSKELENQAIQCFRNVTGFMGDRNSKKEETGHAEKLLKSCLQAPVELRDEVFCQIIKQTTNNPSPESALKGWMLLGVTTGAFSPSKEFEPYLLSYCEAHKEDSGGVAEYAKFCMGRILKTSALGPRKEVPTAMEIEAAKMRLPVLVRVYHLDGSFDVLPVSSWVTPGLLKAMVCEKRGINDGEAFGIYEMTPEGEERFLDPEERILDVVAYWQRLFEEEKSKGDDGATKKQKKKALGNNFYRIVFKVHMYFEPAASDFAAHHEMYIQAVYDVVSARYPCGERDCIALASLQLQSEFGDSGLPDLKEKLIRFLPAKYAEGTRQSELASEIRKAHAQHAGKTSEAAEREYLEYVKEWQVYGSSFFFVEPQMSVDLPDEVFLAVNPKGILIINPDTKEVLATHPYSEVPTWGHSGSSFVLHIGNLIRQNKLYFATEQGKEINDLVRAYVNHLCVSA